MNKRELALRELQHHAEKTKELLWVFLDEWYPPEYGQVAMTKDSMNGLLDAIDSLEEEREE